MHLVCSVLIITHFRLLCIVMQSALQDQAYKMHDKFDYTIQDIFSNQETKWIIFNFNIFTYSCMMSYYGIGIVISSFCSVLMSLFN